MKRSIHISGLPENWGRTHSAGTILLNAAKGMKLKVVTLKRQQDSVSKFINSMAGHVPRDYGVLVPVRHGKSVRHYIVHPGKGFENMVHDNRTDFVDLTGMDLGFIHAYDYANRRSRARECKEIGEYKNMKMKLDTRQCLKYAKVLLKKTDNKIR